MATARFRPISALRSHALLNALRGCRHAGRRSEDTGLGLLGDPPHEVAGPRQVLDQPTASPTVTLAVVVARRIRLLHVPPPLGGRRAQVVLAAVPGLDEGVMQEASGIGRRPGPLAGDVVDLRAHRVVANGGEHPLLGRRMDVRWSSGPSTAPSAA
ncbi:hypothetical protein ACRAWG_24175 [Methylobacterium sp. P31]